MQFLAREKDLRKVVSDILNNFGRDRVFAMEGTLGAGKTTMIKVFCEELGVIDTVASPTFSIVNEYQTDHDEVVYHFDFYRIKNAAEALDIGYYEYIESGNFCFIEWPEKIRELLPGEFVYIKLEDTGNEGERKITVSR